MLRTLPLIGLAVLGCCSLPVASPAATGCRQVPNPAPSSRSEPKPTGSLAAGARYDVVFQTNCGSFTVRLDQAQSPQATVSFASLAEHGFFDGTVFDRIVPDYVIQGGDPTQTQTGGPGYSTVDVPPAAAAYTHGVVAMAKSGLESPGTAGSQFFIVTEADAGLPPDYAIVGKVIKGLDVVDRIGKLGNEAQQPTEVVEIERVTLHGPPFSAGAPAESERNWWAIGGLAALIVVILLGGGFLLTRMKRRGSPAA